MADFESSSDLPANMISFSDCMGSRFEHNSGLLAKFVFSSDWLVEPKFYSGWLSAMQTFSDWLSQNTMGHFFIWLSLPIRHCDISLMKKYYDSLQIYKKKLRLKLNCALTLKIGFSLL
jgi:hypothetical protein